MVRGSCLCKGIEFEADRIVLIRNCHCSRCRKESGAAFAAAALAQPNEFRFLGGQDLVHYYEYPPNGRRAFCQICGSKAPLALLNDTVVLIPAGLLDDDPVVRPALHMFVGSKASWWDIQDDLPQFETWVPGFEPKSSG